MQVQIRGRRIDLTAALRGHVERRLQFALSRFGDRIGRVAVQLADINGPRGGDDKSCRINVSVRPSKTVFVEAVKADLCAAIDQAAERAGRSVGRELELDRVFEGAANGPRRSKTR